LPVGELIAEGNIGMMQADSTSTPKKLPPGTYAIWWIKAAMQEYILRLSMEKLGSSGGAEASVFLLRKLKAKIGATAVSASGG